MRPLMLTALALLLAWPAPGATQDAVSAPARAGARKAPAGPQDAGPAAGAQPAAAARPAPTLTLAGALERAERHAFANRVAAAAAEERSAAALGALRGVLPTVRVEAGWLRTTDPVGAFGVALRERRIGPADFDPARLNHPDPASDYAASVVVEQPLLNADAHFGRAAAARGAAAAEAAEAWARTETRVQVVRAYYGALLAWERVATLEAAARAAHEHVRRAEALVENGLATRSDALLAAVKSGEVDAELIAARGAAGVAKRRLALVLGQPDDTAFSLPSALPPAEALAALGFGGGEVGAAGRGDVVAAGRGEAAARADVSRARASLLPRLNAFARYDWNSPDRPFGGDEHWTVGVMASWTPFAGLSNLAEVRAAEGRAAAARAGAEASRARALLEAEEARSAWEVALARLEIAGRAVAQSAEAHRIVARKYEGGLATVLELLDAAAAETQAALGRSHALYGAIVAGAERLRAEGLDPAALVILDTPAKAMDR